APPPHLCGAGEDEKELVGKRSFADQPRAGRQHHFVRQGREPLELAPGQTGEETRRAQLRLAHCHPFVGAEADASSSLALPTRVRRKRTCSHGSAPRAGEPRALLAGPDLRPGARSAEPRARSGSPPKVRPWPRPGSTATASSSWRTSRSRTSP